MRLNIFNILQTFTQTILDTQKSGKVTDKYLEQKEMRGLMANEKFLLSLAASGDIYFHYGRIIEILQKVNLLPHQRMEKFNTAIEVFKAMKESFEDHEICKKQNPKLEGFNCNWSRFHEDIDTLTKDGKIMDVIILDKHQIKAAGLLCRTRSTLKKEEEDLNLGSLEAVKSRIMAMLNFMYDNLKKDVFDENDIKIIKHTKTILDVTSLAVQLRVKDAKSPILLAIEKAPKFIEAVRSLPIKSLEIVPDSIFSTQYTCFLDKLKTVSLDYKLKDLKKIDPKDILKLFVKSDLKLFNNCEMIIHAIMCASVKISVESIVESMISVYENHVDGNRNLDDDSAAQEFIIAYNGPNLAHCDDIVREAMCEYWKKGKINSNWHFVKDKGIKKYLQKSLVLERKKKKAIYPSWIKYPIVFRKPFNAHP